jgi:Helix-turn-helix domain of resolvase
MYCDVGQWRHIRTRILEKGTPKKQVARETGVSRRTINKMLTHEHPPGYGLDRSGTQNWNPTYERSIDYCTIPFHFRQGPI